MKKKYAIDQLQEAITKVNNIVDNRVGCFQEPIIPSDCPTFDEATAKRKATKYNYDYRIWHDYAGDYKHK